MPLSSAPPKNPVKVAAGRAGALARWGGERRVVRLDGLDPTARRLILAMIEAARKPEADS